MTTHPLMEPAQSIDVNMTSKELDIAIAAARAGNEKGYRMLFSEFSPAVFRLVSRIVADKGEAEELTQDTFLKAFGALGDFRKQGAGFGAWIRRIAYHTAISSLRRANRVQISTEDIEALDAAEEAEQDAEDISTALENAIATLTEEEQTILQLFYVEDLPLREIAYVMSSNVPLMATRLSRIRKRLKKKLEKS